MVTHLQTEIDVTTERLELQPKQQKDDILNASPFANSDFQLLCHHHREDWSPNRWR